MNRLAFALIVAMGALAVFRTAASSEFAPSPAKPELMLIELAPSEVPPDVPEVAWVGVEDVDWANGDPAFTMADAESGTSADGWLAVTSEGIRMRVAVRDDVHFNDRRGGDIWDGDNLQIGIDALGDGAGPEREDAMVTRPDDAELCIALTGETTTFWAHWHGRPGGEGALPDGYGQVTRDEDTGATVYEVRLPWSEFQAQAGQSPVIGLRVQCNDSDGKGVRRAFHWGNPDSRGRPGLFNRLRIGNPPGEFAAASPPSTSLWRADGFGEIAFYVASSREPAVRARVADTARDFALPSGQLTDGVRRFAVRAAPGELPAAPVPFEADLVAGDEVLASAAGELAAPVRLVERLREQTERLALAAPHPLFARHLRAVGALAQSEWERAMAVVEADEKPALDAVRYVQQMLEALESRAGTWQPYAERRRPLVMAFVSELDRTLQPYHLALPPGWDAQKAYPLVVNLHGAGNDHPLSFVLAPLTRQDDPDEEADLPPRTEECIEIWPWGRGNLSYMGVGETDVWEAIEDAKKTVQVDEDRQYLTGFSMGGAGTWHLALRTPDRWAAVCVYSGGTWAAPTGRGLGRNVVTLPVRIAHGEQDGAISVREAYAMQAELRRYGKEPDMRIVPDLGHTYPAWLVRENLNWMLQHARQRPDEFCFVADTDEHRGAWGIWMDRDISVCPLPRVTCRVDGDTVWIDSEGTRGVSVDLGPDGLALGGEATVFWNGRKEYQGGPEEVTLGEGGGRRR
jgi:predicted esterase